MIMVNLMIDNKNAVWDEYRSASYKWVDGLLGMEISRLGDDDDAFNVDHDDDAFNVDHDDDAFSVDDDDDTFNADHDD